MKRNSIGAVLDLDLTPLEREVLLALIERAPRSGPLIEENAAIAERLRKSVRSVQRGLAGLEAKGVIAREFDPENHWRVGLTILVDIGRPATRRRLSQNLETLGK